MTSFAILSDLTMLNGNPASGTPLNPKISIGIEGPDVFDCEPLSFIIALIFPEYVPQTIKSPLFISPSLGINVATTPRPLSRYDYKIKPFAGILLFAFNSIRSD